MIEDDSRNGQSYLSPETLEVNAFHSVFLCTSIVRGGTGIESLDDLDDTPINWN